MLIDRIGSAPLHGPNDLVFNREGTLIFTDPGGSTVQTPTGRVVRRAADGESDVIAVGLAYPNGLALSPDESLLYVAETHTNRILRLSLAGRGRPGVFCTLPGRPGPDGLAVGPDGVLYVAHHGNGAVVAIDRDGRILGGLPAGGNGPTNCTIADDVLYVTEDDSASVYRLRLW